MNKQDILDYVSTLTAKDQQLFQRFTTKPPLASELTEEDQESLVSKGALSAIEFILKEANQLCIGDKDKIQYIKGTSPEDFCYSLSGAFSKPISPFAEFLMYFVLEHFVLKELCKPLGLNHEVMIKEMKSKDYSTLTVFCLAGCFHLAED